MNDFLKSLYLSLNFPNKKRCKSSHYTCSQTGEGTYLYAVKEFLESDFTEMYNK